MSVYALMATMNEADRFLHCALTHLTRFADGGIVVFDDQSTDGTLDIARQFTPWVITRHPGTPTFLEHEGLFRSAAWDAMEAAVHPVEGDWVLSIDADEVLAVTDDNWGIILRTAAVGACTISTPIPEVFQLDPLMVRTDGWWDRGRDTRLIAWQPEGFTPACTCPDENCRRERFLRQPMASGHAPGYARYKPALHVDANEAAILHLGYAEPEDRIVKYQRYRDVAGHSRAHIESILAAPSLRPWPGPDINIWRGPR